MFKFSKEGPRKKDYVQVSSLKEHIVATFKLATPLVREMAVSKHTEY
jgi:hypothetical protein